MKQAKYEVLDVLCYSATPKSRTTVTNYYRKWRHSASLPNQCDNPECVFHSQPLQWNGKPLSLIVDHCNGNRNDNRSENLRLVCPNCDSQAETRGGKNKDRIRNATENGYEVAKRDGTQDANVFPKGVAATVIGGVGGNKRLKR